LNDSAVTVDFEAPPLFDEEFTAEMHNPVLDHDEFNEEAASVKLSDKISDSSFEIKADIFSVVLISLNAADSLIEADFYLDAYAEKAAASVKGPVILDADLLLQLHKNSLEKQIGADLDTLHRLDEHIGSIVKSYFLTFVCKYSSIRFCMLFGVFLSSIVNSEVENSVFYLKLKKINFDLWPI